MRQLNLFKGNRQRGEALPPPLEFSNHVALADLLRRWCMPAWRWTHLPFGELRDFTFDKRGRRWSPSGQRLKRMGTQPGWPDFLFAGPDAKVVWLELKRARKGKASEAQILVEEHLLKCGFEYLITDDIDEAIAFLKRLGILRAIVGGV